MKVPAALTSCEVCGTASFRQILDLGLRGMFEECVGCGLVRLNTSVTFDYRTAGVNYLMLQAASGARLHEWTVDVLEEHVGRGTLVEVACSVGTQLASAKRRGWSVLGFEINPDCIEVASRLHDVEVRCEDFLRHDLRGSADAVLMCQFIEHVGDPRPFLEAAARALRGGGILAIATPNWNFAIPWVWLNHKFGLRMPDLDHIQPPQHIRLYRPRTFERLAQETGWRVRATYDNPTHFLGQRKRLAPRSLLGEATAWINRLSGHRLALGPNMLAVLERQQ